MNTKRSDEELLDDFLVAYVEKSSDLPPLPTRLSSKADERIAVVDQLRQHWAEQSAVNKLSSRLGFDLPERVVVEPKSLNRRRQEAEVSTGELRDALAAAGAVITNSMLRGWLTSTHTVTLDRSIVVALASILGAAPQSFTARDTTRTPQEAFLASKAVRDLAAEVARRTGNVVDDLIDLLRRRMPATAYRAESTSDEQLIMLARIILESSTE